MVIFDEIFFCDSSISNEIIRMEIMAVYNESSYILDIILWLGNGYPKLYVFFFSCLLAECIYFLGFVLIAMNFFL